MSYLDVPRLHFFGVFSTNPSTINNLSDTEYCVGTLRMVPFNDLWARVSNGSPDPMFSA